MTITRSFNKEPSSYFWLSPKVGKNPRAQPTPDLNAVKRNNVLNISFQSASLVIDSIGISLSRVQNKNCCFYSIQITLRLL